MRDAWPELPDGVADRDGDVWESLLAVADVAAGDWPTRARVTAVAAVTDSKEHPPSLGIRLLSDLRIVFGVFRSDDHRCHLGGSSCHVRGAVERHQRQAPQ